MDAFKGWKWDGPLNLHFWGEQLTLPTTRHILRACVCVYMLRTRPPKLPGLNRSSKSRPSASQNPLSSSKESSRKRTQQSCPGPDWHADRLATLITSYASLLSWDWTSLELLYGSQVETNPFPDLCPDQFHDRHTCWHSLGGLAHLVVRSSSTVKTA